MSSRGARLALIPAIAVIAGCGDRAETSRAEAKRSASESAGRRAATAAPSFVGAELCGSCHTRELESWRGSHHALAMQAATERSVLGKFDGAKLTQGGVTTRFFSRDGRFFAHSDGPDGVLRDYEIAYTFGVEPLQQYLIAFPGGRLQALGVAWDSRSASEGGQRWFHLYPDEVIPHGDALHWTGPNQNWNFMCAECHSTNLQKNYVARESRYETRWSEINVACEACHGAGSAHVAWAREPASADASTSGSANRGLGVDLRSRGRWHFEEGAPIAKRTPPAVGDAQLDTCARCHSRRSLLREEPPRGQPLLDTHRPALLDERLYFADGQIREEVYEWGSFLQSRMYAAGVLCSDCHEPHSLALRADSDQTCLACHRTEAFAQPDHHHHEPSSPGASCVACHMSARSYMGVDARRDHSFRVPRPDLTEKIGVPNACADCHADRSAAWASAAVERWHGTARRASAHYGEILYAGRRSLPGASRALADLAEDRAMPAIVRASALRLMRPGSREADALRGSLRDPEAIVRLAALEAAESVEPALRISLARALLGDPVRAVRIEAARSLALIPAALWEPGDAAKLEGPRAEYRAAQAANAERPEAHLNLASLALASRDFDAARSELERALELGPWFVPAYVNLADVYRALGREAEAESVLRGGLARVGESAELRHALGLALVRARRSDEARAELARASELAPEISRYAYAYGVALHSAGAAQRARAVLEEAQRRHPGDPDLLAALATMSRDAGDLEAALAYAVALTELLPDDLGAQRLLAELRSRADSGSAE
ncbi:MAG TPA: tetratricopeptide repeat protein [Myxococcota bacterium]|nr:tetratricopeptide repeat protein [Myxococcota bacterium]